MRSVFRLIMRLLHLPFLLILVVPIITRCEKQHAINQTEVAEHVRYLSSDELMGRKSLTPGIEKAENYIAGEFKKAKLGYFSGLDTYKQSFDLIEYSISETSISVNGKELPSEDYFAFLHTDSIDWKNGDIQTATIAEDSNFRSEFRTITRSENDLIVFVDYSHEETFHKYQPYFSKPAQNIEGSTDPSIVFILTSVTPKTFEVSIKAEKEKHTLTNVVGVVEGKRKDEFVLFSAHHDHLGVRSAVESDSIANGANDNASGVAAIIELAKYFSTGPKPERSLMFVTFTAEEMGGYGSRYFSEQLDPDQITAMFNIEMIGKPAVSGPNSAWITGYERSTFGEILSNSMPDSVYEFYPDPYPNQNLFYRSDNATLARLGVPAHSISTTPIDVDNDYHRVSDEFETLDIPHLTHTVQAIAKAARIIVSGEETPTRVDTSQVD